MELSLDEIIARQKKNGRGNASTKDSGNRRRGKEFGKKFESSDAAFTKNVPVGKWGHDGFEEMYGGGGPHSSRRPARGTDVPVERILLSKKVKVLINNLAPTVTTSDLLELFEAYHFDSANVHYDEDGESVGSADLVIDRLSAEELMKQFKGVAVDGKTLHMFLIDESNSSAAAQKKSIKNRVTFSKAPSTRSGVRGITKPKQQNIQRAGGRDSNWRKGKRGRQDTRKQMSQEDLDRELDEYMKKGTGASAQEMES